jgi:Family of unknown function (DUF6328)
MGRQEDAKPDGRDETEAERADRNFTELLQELRVAQTGVQILFAFLVTLPFSQRFGTVTANQKALYLIALIAAALSMVCLVAPVSQHRILFGQGLKPELVQSGSRFAYTGTAFLLVAVIVALLLIVDVVAGVPAAIGVCVVIGAGAIVAWYALPLRLRRRARR